MIVPAGSGGCRSVVSWIISVSMWSRAWGQSRSKFWALLWWRLWGRRPSGGCEPWAQVIAGGGRSAFVMQRAFTVILAIAIACYGCYLASLLSVCPFAWRPRGGRSGGAARKG